MKISLQWALDHIDPRYRSQLSIDAIVAKFNESTAEIEAVRSVRLRLDNLACVQIKKITDQQVEVYAPELEKTLVLSPRSDARVEGWYLVRIEGKKADWAVSTDLGGEKEMTLPEVAITTEQARGAWRKQVEAEDHIITIDNKSITHRPDMWGHRGFAREIAALFNVSLVPLEKLLASHTVHDASQPKNSLSLSIKDIAGCSRFAGLLISQITYVPSYPTMVSRLSRVDSRSINGLVDMTNYVMFDLSEPMHAFDARAIQDKSLTVRRAKADEKLVLLDGQTISLTQDDMVVADVKEAVSLAGIMGGKKSAVTPQTQSIILEAAHFDATTIRISSQRHKVRSESSARFEKSLDPEQNIFAIKRFLKLLSDYKIQYVASDTIISLGKLPQPPVITVAHDYIESQLGVSLNVDFVVNTLSKLEFIVAQEKSKTGVVYTITVPLFRATKDIAIKQDIVEEIARFYGYSNIPLALPYVQTTPKWNREVERISRIKHELAYGLSMRELYTYALFDESFLRELAWDPGDTLSVKSPVSENWCRLITTVLPALFKAVRENSIGNDQLRFFEWGRTWQNDTEKKVVAGIVFDKHKAFTFYDVKDIVQRICAMLSLPVSYVHLEHAHPWFDAAQSAHVIHDDVKIGVLGKINDATAKIMGEGGVYAFELDGDFLEQYRAPQVKCHAVSKYPAVDRDISMLVPLSRTVQEISGMISQGDDRIVSVVLRDFFQKKEWADQKSLTFRYVMRDMHKTLTKEDVEHVHERIIKSLENLGATIR